MGVFEMHNTKKKIAFSFGGPNARTCTLKVQSILLMMPEIVGVLRWCPKHAYLCITYASNSVFGYPVWMCLKWTMPKIVGFWRGAPSTQTPALHIPVANASDT